MTAEKLVHSILFTLKQNHLFYQFDIFYYSLLRLRPLVLLRPVKVGASIFPVPAPISDHKRRLYAIKFVLSSSKNSRGSVDVGKIAPLLFATYTATKNAALDKKLNVYRDAIDNRMFIRNLKFF